MSVCHVKSRQEVEGKHIWGVESVGAITRGVESLSSQPPEDRSLSISTADVRKAQMRLNMSEAAGPDHLCVLRTNASRLVDVISDI